MHDLVFPVHVRVRGNRVGESGLCERSWTLNARKLASSDAQSDTQIWSSLSRALSFFLPLFDRIAWRINLERLPV